VRLLYHPPYYSKYNPIERWWRILENQWKGAIFASIDAILNFTASMTWNGILLVVDVITKI
jgi:transposase